jgi:GNAT superfamily N-acetyltransferase
MSVTVRTPRPGDGAGLARVWLSAAAYYADLGPEYFQVPPAEGLAESFEAGLGTDAEDGLMLVAELHRRLAGWLTARIEHAAPGAARQMVREHGRTRLIIDALLVDQAVWREGAGTALLTAAEAWGRDRGAEVVRLDTYAGSPVSVPFYERHMGYQRRSIVFQKPLR